ncbi:MAG TPA: hypothetical protein VNN79_01575 [Actinomycetota bacterium]|nr:hypothetical protein [Actinomycetota bacterium]
MPGKRVIDKVILGLLVVGAVVFILLLAGVGSSVFTNPTPYHVPTP